MKPEAYARLSLIFPYALWVMLAGFMFVARNFFPAIENVPVLSGLITISFLYVFGILLWGIPYTILAFCLWLWSRRKPAGSIAKAFAVAPWIMSLLVIGELAILSQMDRHTGLSSDFGDTALAMMWYCLLYGYGIVGIVAAIYKLLQSRNFIELE